MTDTLYMEQGTDEWLRARLGRVTASRIADVVARTKSGPSASRANYMAELLAERLTDQPQDGYFSREMQWGLDHEDDARREYEWRVGVPVEEIGFVPHPTIEMAGASPDGRVGTDGLIEIKCPNTATHIAALEGEPIADKYIVQMQWQLACEDRQWCHYVSFDPRMPAHLQLHTRCVWRDDKRIAELEDSVREFLAELDARITRLEEIYRGTA